MFIYIGEINNVIQVKIKLNKKVFSTDDGDDDLDELKSSSIAKEEIIEAEPTCLKKTKELKPGILNCYTAFKIFL